jgi:hypothetical protein
MMSHPLDTPLGTHQLPGPRREIAWCIPVLMSVQQRVPPPRRNSLLLDCHEHAQLCAGDLGSVVHFCGAARWEGFQDAKVPCSTMCSLQQSSNTKINL